MGTPKVSVVVAVYKAEKYIHKCIDSILSQTLKDFEVILVDDGSPDKSGAICDEYASQDSRIKVVHKENGGVSSARQCGMDEAQGEYIIHVDPDDWVEPDMLDALYNIAISENADMVMCDLYENASNKQIYRSQTPSSLNHEVVLREIFLHLHGSCCNKLVKLACLKEYNITFPKGINFCEDLYINAMLLKENIKIVYLNKAFYHYVQDINEQSLVNKSLIRFDNELISKFEEILPKEIFRKYAKPHFLRLFVPSIFFCESILDKEYSEHVRPYKWELFSLYRGIGRIKSFIFFISCFGLRSILRKFYVTIKEVSISLHIRKSNL